MSDYPPHITFDTPARRAFAESFADDIPLFYAGGILAEEETGWENVLQHCVTCAWVADTLLAWVEEACPDVSLPRREMVRATFIHDAYKRREVEQYAEANEPPDFFWHIDAKATDWMRARGVPDAVLRWFDAFGNNAALALHGNPEPDLGTQILHLVDDSVHGDRFEGFEERLNELETNKRYQAQNEWSRHRFDGETLYGAKRVIHEITTARLCALLSLADDAALQAALTKRLSSGNS
jgi:hypothetical protein